MITDKKKTWTYFKKKIWLVYEIALNNVKTVNKYG